MMKARNLSPRKSSAQVRAEELIELIEAGRAALAKFETEKAIACFESALQSPFLNAEQRASVCCLLAEALENLARYSEAIEVMAEYEQSVARADLHPVVLYQVYLRMGSVYAYAGEHPKAISYAKSALALAEERGDLGDIGAAHLILGRIYRAIGETRFARDHFLQALKQHRITGRAFPLAQSYFGLGNVSVSEGDFANARNYFEQALKLLQEDDSPLLLGNIYLNLAALILLQEQGQASEGIELLSSAVFHFKRANHKRLLARAYNNLGYALLRTGQLHRAREMVGAALSVAREVGDHRTIPMALESLGEIATISGQFAEAEALLQQSIETAQAFSDRFAQSQTYLTLGRCHLLSGNYGRAAEAFQAAFAISEQMDDKRGQAAAQLFLAEYHYEVGEEEAAQAIVAEVGSRVERLSNTLLIGHLRELTGRLEACRGRYHEAIHYLSQAVSIFEMVSNRYLSGTARYHLGRAHAEAGNLEQARQELEQARQVFTALEACPMLARTKAALQDLPAAAGARREEAGVPSLSSAVILRLAGAASSRELLLHELSLVIREELQATPVILYEETADTHLKLVISQGCDPAQAAALAEEIARARGKAGAALPKAALYELNAGEQAPVVLYVGDETSSLHSARQFIDPLIKLTELGLELCALRSRVHTIEGYDLDQSQEKIELPGLVYQSAAMRSLIEQIHKIRSSNVTALITGESGTGKEVLARAIHALSDRREAPFVAFNCTVAPKEIIDSQLFGHRRGAFTGANTDYQGVIRSAAGGTLFLDEIGDLSLEVQPKLLRFLQEGEIQPLGETKPVKVDVRVIAATNCDLEKLVAEGKFREDLYYRLNVIRLRMPPLRERREEIPMLVNHLIERYAHQEHKQHITITPQALDLMMVYDWPGNVRQLANEIQRLVALTPSGGEITEQHLSPMILRTGLPLPDGRGITSMDDLLSPEALGRQSSPASPPAPPPSQKLAEAVAELERRMITAALERHCGNISRAAAELGLTRRGLYLKMERYQITDFRN